MTEGLSSLTPYAPHAVIAIISLFVGLFGKQGWAAFSRVILVERRKVPAENALTFAQAGRENRESDVKFVEAIEHAAVMITARYTASLEEIDKLKGKYDEQTGIIFEQARQIKDLQESDSECQVKLADAQRRINILESKNEQ